MDAIAFDLDTEQLQPTCSTGSWSNACVDSRRELEAYGFQRQHGSVYFGGDGIRSKDSIKAIPGFPRITHVMGGEACIRGVRVTFGMILGDLDAGVSIEELPAFCNDIEREDVPESMRHHQHKEASSCH
jgi:virulence-associated protein VapD